MRVEPLSATGEFELPRTSRLLRQLQCGIFRSAAEAKVLPEPKPGAAREHFVMPAVGGRNVAGGEGSYVRSFEHLLELLDFADDALNVHRFQYSQPAWHRA